MKKLIILIIFLITISSAYAATVSITVPFRYKYGPYNDTHTYFELVNRVNSYPYKLVYWPNETEDDKEWDFTYHFDTEEVCNGTSEVTACESGYNWSETFYNMTDNIRMMLDTMNMSHELSQNLTQEISLNEPLIEDLGRCRGKVDELDNQTGLLFAEKQELQGKVDFYLPYEGRYNTCVSELTTEKEKLKTYAGGGAAVGGLLVYLFVGKKKNVEETEEVTE